MAPITGVLVLEAGIEAACVVGAAVGAVTSGCPKGEAEDDDDDEGVPINPKPEDAEAEVSTATAGAAGEAVVPPPPPPRKPKPEAPAVGVEAAAGSFAELGTATAGAAAGSELKKPNEDGVVPPPPPPMPPPVAGAPGVLVLFTDRPPNMPPAPAEADEAEEAPPMLSPPKSIPPALFGVLLAPEGKSKNPPPDCAGFSAAAGSAFAAGICGGPCAPGGR